MNRLAIALSIVFFGFLVAQQGPLEAKPLDADLAQHSVDIDHRFSGADILLFGARNDVGRVVVALRGPKQDYIVRKKERVMGVWVNRHAMTFREVPSFFSVASTDALQTIGNDGLLDDQQLRINALDWQVLDAARATDAQALENQAAFRNALVAYLSERELYNSELLPVSFWGETLFRSLLHFPKQIGRGWYTAEVYLFNNGMLSSYHVTPIEVRKIGFEAWLFDFAHSQSLLYGMLCVVLALVTGWLASVIFGRR